ncbi:hypothetical protein Lal_00040190 [Lupinus albus]|nr:hypothetical protein Lal_00040190 [Lupinus albus]
MDSNDIINTPLLYSDPMCYFLNLLVDIATGLHLDQDTTSSIPSLKIVKYDANVEHLKTHNKPTKFMTSSFAAYSILKFHQHTMETITKNANKVLIKDDNFPSTFMNPINFKHDNDEDEYLLIKEKKLKGKYVAISNDRENLDVLYQDWVPSKSSPNKSVDRSTRKRKRLNVVVEVAPSELPQEFINKINEMNGSEITLLITKPLFDSDLNGQQNRLSIPLKQIENVNFLREGELEDLEGGKGIELKLIQPSLEVINMTLAKWNLHKNNGRITSSYVLRSSSWKKVTRDNQLRVHDRIQVWSFRVQEELCITIVKI